MDKPIDARKKRDVQHWTAKKIISTFKSGELDLETEYQRDPIWTKEKKQLLIDSILNDIDIPKIYLAYFTKEKKYECIDGKQRITSIIDFYDNILSLETGEYHKDLSKSKQDIFSKYDFSVSIIANPSDNDISKLFERLNIGDPLNGGERIHAMRGDMRNFIFDTIGKNGPFIGKVGMKEYRFSREIALAQMIINSLVFREKDEFARARYENIRDFLSKGENIKFSTSVKTKVEKIKFYLKKIEQLFGKEINKLKRKAAIVSAYLFFEEQTEEGKEKDLTKFPEFYLKLLERIQEQANLIKGYDIPTNKIILERFQKNLQQASVEDYSIERRHKFLQEAFKYYLKTGKIIGDKN